MTEKKYPRPLNDRVLLERFEAETKTAGGILIPDNAKEKPLEACVVAVGPGKILDNGNRQPMCVRQGERVLIGKWAGTELKVEGKDYLLVKEDEILAIMQ